MGLQNLFTHILCLYASADIIEHRQRNNVSRRNRREMTVPHLDLWQAGEVTELRSLYYKNGILFTQLDAELPSLLDQSSDLLWNFCSHSETGNLVRATEKLSRYAGADRTAVTTMIVVDADKTLAAADTGKMFRGRLCKDGKDPLKALFSSPMGYLYTAFRQAALLYEEVRDNDFDDLCQTVASSVTVRPEFLSLCYKIAAGDRVRAVIVTCGLYRI
ncbi:hypothetical protein LTR37_021412 [Vermiconidia calcicola]|uniref:Uncharacterized protein n=1 Tax=Vermiconidia calcicola TaxID=1690605 RepID=A0ACC3M8S3_9PEZI|nr:hypothetical protein LTR37_021412 [Vermiconidia calcicola]